MDHYLTKRTAVPVPLVQNTIFEGGTMRVIAGTHKGRPLKSVPGKGTRPTGDKIKEAAFHKMGPFFQGGRGLDLFAGSGSLGIEALSRGIDHITFVDQSRQAVQTIHNNLQSLQLERCGSVYRNDAFRALSILHKQEQQFELILLDPPYEKINYQRLLDQIVGYNNLVKHKAYIYIEHGPNKEFSLPNDAFSPIFSKNYNEMTSVTIYKKQ